MMINKISIIIHRNLITIKVALLCLLGGLIMRNILRGLKVIFSIIRLLFVQIFYIFRKI